MGLAGLRLGYLAGPAAWLKEIDKTRLPYNINVLTQASAAFGRRRHQAQQSGLSGHRQQFDGKPARQFPVGRGGHDMVLRKGPGGRDGRLGRFIALFGHALRFRFSPWALLRQRPARDKHEDTCPAARTCACGAGATTSMRGCHNQ